MSSTIRWSASAKNDSVTVAYAVLAGPLGGYTLRGVLLPYQFNCDYNFVLGDYFSMTRRFYDYVVVRRSSPFLSDFDAAFWTKAFATSFFVVVV